MVWKYCLSWIKTTVMHQKSLITQFTRWSCKGVSLLMFFILNHLGLIMNAQHIYSTTPEKINPENTYLFYLHGAIVQQQGANAISDRFGAYQYANIVQAFADKGYQVISEVRPKDAKIAKYAVKISNEITDLISSGVPANRITVIGASMGGYIAVEAAYQLKNANLNYAVLGLCSEYAFKYFSNHNSELCGNFFSIYEKSDEANSCSKLLNSLNCGKNFKELALNMGNGHGFLYKPYPEWMNPLSEWINTKK